MVLNLLDGENFSSTPYTKMLILKVITIAQGIYYLSVELGRSQGLRKTVVSLKEYEIFIVLITLSFTSTMFNIHTLSWNFERAIIVIAFDILFIYLVVNIVFYLGEIKYYFLYAIPMFIVFIGLNMLKDGYKGDKNTAYLQTQVGIICTLILSAIYLFVKMQYEVVESRSIIRKIDAVDIDELGL